MKTDTSKVTIHMVSSLDGFIAKKDGSVSWLQSNDHYEKGATLTEEYIEEFIKTIDCYVMGSRTYEHALELGWPYGEGTLFFDYIGQEQPLHLKDVTAYKDGMVELWYEIKK